MDAGHYSSAGGESVTLLSYVPRTGSRPSQHSRVKQNKSDKFSFKFRRRSKSAPRNHQNTTDKDLSGKITYSANGETKLKNPDSPFKGDAVQLVGFCSYKPLTESGVASGDSWADSGSGHSTLSSDTLSAGQRTLSRTSKDIKMERERLRQERLNNRPAAWRQLDSLESGAAAGNNNKLSSLETRLAEERAKFLEDAKLFYGGDSAATELFTQFLKERDQRMSGAGAAFPGSGVSSGVIGGDKTRVSSQLISAGVNSDMSEHETLNTERIIPIIRDHGTNTGDHGTQSQVRIIPVRIETSEDSDSSDTQSPDTVSPDEPDQQESLSTLPSLFSDIKMLHNHPSSKRTSYHHPSFANHFGLAARLRHGDPSEKSILFSGAGIRDSFPGFPSFGNFPSFTPLLSDRQPLQERTRFRDKSKADNIHKQRSAKSKSSLDFSSSDKASDSSSLPR